MDGVEKTKRGSRGFTLAEVLVAVAIFAVMFVISLLLYDRANRVFKKGVEDADLQQTTRVGFDKLVADIRMTGFDYDRDGSPIASADMIWQANLPVTANTVAVPTVANGHTYRVVASGTTGAAEPTWPVVAGGRVVDNTVTWAEQPGIYRFQQPDEAVEYIARSAITIRANFDYSSDIAPCPNPSGCDNGREPTYESSAFPVVTTGNDEIVTYALVSDDPTKNVDTISFYADFAVPRNVFPGSATETLVTINNVDLSNQNPPYTLYRFTLSPTGEVVRTAAATNIRQMTFEYFSDTAAQTPMTGRTNAPLTAAADFGIGGSGRYDPANPEEPVARDYRDVRASIKSIKIGLVGINPVVTDAYVDSVETSTQPSLRNTRKYRLESVVVPRNVDMRGMRELDVNPPGQPVVETACVGYCGVAQIHWSPAAVNSDQGSADDYDILWDTDPNGPFSRSVPTGGGTSGYVFNLDPAQSYHFKVRARNAFGSATSANSVQAAPTNTTTPAAPQQLTATGGLDPASAQANQVVLTWQRPFANVSPSNLITCVQAPGPSGGTQKIAEPLAAELQGYRVHRSTDPTFATFTEIINENVTGGRAPATSDTTVTFTDTTAANCVTYYYRVAAVEWCNAKTDYNIAPAAGISAVSAIVSGQAKTIRYPSDPSDLFLTSPSCAGPPGNVQCTINLSWPRVTTDEPAPKNNISIDQYVIKRVRKLGGVEDPEVPVAPWQSCTGVKPGEPGLCNTVSGYAGPTATPMATAIDSVLRSDPAGNDYTYEYQVAALQCNLLSAFKPVPPRTFPCQLGGNNNYDLAVALPAAYDGDGVTTPWVVSNPDTATLQVNITPNAPLPTNPIVSIGGQVYVGSTFIAALTPVTGASVMSASFDLPAGPGDGTLFTIVVAATDSKGCTKTAVRYVTDSPSGCCIAPQSVDPSVVLYVPGNAFVDITLRNVCGESLAIQAGGVPIGWAPTATPAGTQLIGVDWPSATGGTPVVQAFNDSSGLITAAPPAGAVSRVPGNFPTSWTSLTAYAAGAVVQPANGHRYMCVTAGTSGITQPAFPTAAGATIADGTAVWKEMSSYTIRVRFSNPIVGAKSPITSACAIYRRTSDTTNQNCKFIPQPSATANSCN